MADAPFRIPWLRVADHHHASFWQMTEEALVNGPRFPPEEMGVLPDGSGETLTDLVALWS
jgi:hypothetical protein